MQTEALTLKVRLNDNNPLVFYECVVLQGALNIINN